jgi:hypothetical protein
VTLYPTEAVAELAKAAGRSRPAPDACAHGVSRDRCHVGCGYRCKVARRVALAGAAPPPADYTLRTASPSVAADHTACGTNACCGICNQGEPTT